jgi:hypothetical protein
MASWFIGAVIGVCWLLWNGIYFGLICLGIYSAIAYYNDH